MKYSEKHIFKIGRQYIQYHPASSREYLEAVLGAEKTLEQKCIRTPKGIYWKDGLQEQPDISFYSGSAGIAYFYIKLYAATGDAKYKKIIDEAMDYLLATWQTFEVAKMSFPLSEAGNGFYTGLVALTTPMIEAYALETEEERRCEIKQAVRAITDRVLKIAREEQGHLYWRKNLSMFYDGGVLLQLAQIADFLKDEKLLETATDSASFLSELAEKSATGGLIYDGYNGANGYVAPNFEFGSAGAGYVLLRFYELTGKKEFLEKAVLCARFLDEISVAQEKGKLIPYRVGEDAPTLFYLGACHGPAGTGKFYYKLYQITKDPKYAPNVYTVPVGYYDGVAGIAGTLLEIHANKMEFEAYLEPGVTIERTQIFDAFGVKQYDLADIPGLENMQTEGLVLEKLIEGFRKIAKEKGQHYVGQTINDANRMCHYKTTGPEIWRDTDGEVDIFVAMAGTAGTLVGTGMYLREQNPDIQIVGVQPHPDSRPEGEHFTGHMIDGVLPIGRVDEKLIPPLILENEDKGFQMDEVIDIYAEDAYATAKELTRTDGLFLGTSAAAAITAGKILAARPENAGKNIVVIIPDNGMKYLSTDMYK